MFDASFLDAVTAMLLVMVLLALLALGLVWYVGGFC